LKHFYDKIQGWGDFKKIYRQQVKDAQDGAHFVEVGAWLGKSTACMAVEIINSDKKIQFDVIDTWKGSKEHKKFAVVKKDTLYKDFLKNMKPVKKQINPIRTTSIEASKLYEDESLDFVFIDASHEYKHVKEDIKHWLPKVKKGGTFGGDDIRWESVQKAVGELLPGYKNHKRYWSFVK
jgi:hypothetical protein